jgi:hypothetical protein
LNSRAPHTGRAASAKIFGRAGCIVTFFDDQKFRTGENYVAIEKLVDEPVEVQLSQNFVNTNAEAGDGVYQGETSEFRWTLFKNVKVSGFWDAMEDCDGRCCRISEQGWRSARKRGERTGWWAYVE